MEILAGIGDFLVKIFPVIAGILIYLIPTAKERMDRKSKAASPVIEIQQGQVIDYTPDYIESLKHDVETERQLAYLRSLLDRNGIPYELGTDGVPYDGDHDYKED